MVTSASKGPTFAAACLLAWAVAAAVLVPRLGISELRAEEGRRAWTARTMLESGEFVVPRIWGRAYLSKPPLHPWSVAAVSTAVAEFAAASPSTRVTPWSARAPSALASLLLVLVVLCYAWRRVGPRAALTAALFVAVAPLFVEKGRLAEIEALLALTSFVSIAALGFTLERARAWPYAIASGIALGAAMLAKGPAALVFFGAAAAGLVWTSRRASSANELPRLTRVVAIALAVGLAIAGTWVALLLAELPPRDVLAHWGNELVAQGERGVFGYVRERPEFIVATLLGMAPASLVLVATLRRGWLAQQLADPRTRLAACTAIPAWLFLLLFPGTAARYAYPILPWVALLAAVSLEDAWTAREPTSARRPVRLQHGIVLLIGAAALFALAATLSPLRERGFDPFDIGKPVATSIASTATNPATAFASTFAMLAAAAAFIAALLAWFAARRSDYCRAGLALILAMAAIHAAEQRFSEARRARRTHIPLAARITAAVPPSATLHVAMWNEFNLLFHVERELIHVEPNQLAELPPGSYVLLATATPPRAGEQLLEAQTRSGPLTLARTAPDRKGGV